MCVALPCPRTFAQESDFSDGTTPRADGACESHWREVFGGVCDRSYVSAPTPKALARRVGDHSALLVSFFFPDPHLGVTLLATVPGSMTMRSIVLALLRIAATAIAAQEVL